MSVWSSRDIHKLHLKFHKGTILSMFISIFRLTKKCVRQYALHILLCIYSTFCFWLSKYTKQALSWHGYTSQTSLGQPRPEGRVESGTRKGSCAPDPQWFPCRKDVGHPGNQRWGGAWLDLLLPPDLIFWSEENLKDALMMTVPVSCMELHWRIFLSLIYSDMQLPGEWCWWMHSQEWHTLS